MKRLFALLAIGLLPLSVFAQAKPSSSAQPASKPVDDGARIVATINGEKLTVDQLNRMWNALSKEMRKNYEISGGGKIGFLDNYIERHLIVQQALKENFEKRKDVAFEIEQARENTLFNEYVSKVIAADVIPESELRAYYDENKGAFTKPERAKARHIMATPAAQPVYNSANDDAQSDEAAKKKIETIVQQLKANPSATNFSDLAGKYSEDVSAKSGGDLGWVARGTLAIKLDEALFKLKPGEISGVVQTEFGYHVIMCEAREPAGTASFEEVRDEVLAKVAAKKQPELIASLRSLIQELRRASAITIYRENL